MLRNKGREEIVELLKSMEFATHKGDEEDSNGSFEYLLSMPIYSLTKERVEDL